MFLEGIPFYRTKEIKELSEGKDISIELFISKKRYFDIKDRFNFEGKLLSEAEIAKCKQEADYEPASVLLERIKEEKNNGK